MILIDTSAWIEFFRPKGDPAVKVLVRDCLASGQAAYSCPIRFELVQGARPNEMADLLTGLDMAKRLPLTPLLWDTAAPISAKARAAGLALPVADILIAVVSVAEDIPLLTRDAHFTLLKGKFLPSLQLV